MPALLHISDPERAALDADLRHRLEQLHGDTANQWGRPEEWMRSILTVWQKHMRHADEVSTAHNARPCTRR